MSTRSALARLVPAVVFTTGLVAASLAPAATAHAASQGATCSGERIGRVPITATTEDRSASMKGAFLHIYRNGGQVCAFTNTSLAAERYRKALMVELYACGRTAGQCRQDPDLVLLSDSSNNDPEERGSTLNRTGAATVNAGGLCIWAWGAVLFNDSRGRRFEGKARSAISCPG